MTGPKSEHLSTVYTVDHKADGTATMGVHWFKNGHETGVWVRYGAETSHKEAFSMMCQGMWEALQDPDSFNIEQDHRGANEQAPYWDALGDWGPPQHDSESK